MRREKGAALLIAVLLIFAVAVFGVIAASSMSSSDVVDSSSQGASVEALFTAETGLERAVKQFASSAPGAGTCATLGGTNIAVAAGRTFTTTNFATDFFGVAPSQSQCRVQVIGTVANTGVSRRLQAVLDRNLISGENWRFNDPLTNATDPNGWQASTAPPTPAPRYDFTGGPEASVVPATARCTRAAYAVKSRSGGAGAAGTYSATMTVAPNFTITPGQTLTIRFNYRVIRIGSSGNNNCASNTGVAPPAGTVANALNVWFSVTDSAANTYTTLGAAVFGAAETNPGAPLNGRTVTSATNCAPTTQRFPADYATCASFYAAATPAAKGQTTVQVAAGSGIITQVRLFMHLPAGAFGNAREAWVDNIEFMNATGKLAARVDQWRDCNAVTCP